jgi:uncharacterized protein
MNSYIVEYIDENIIPLYRNFDAAHREDHVRSVINASLKMAGHYDLNVEMVYVIAAFHDTGLIIDRENHHLESGTIVRNDPMILGLFSAEQVEIMAQAVEDHRASNKKEPRSIYGKIVAEADRLIESTDIVRRTIQYGLSHYPSLDKEGIWKRTIEHLHEKYAEGGYLRLWIPESDNGTELKKLQTLIKDKIGLRLLFDNLYLELQKTIK